MNHNFFHSYIWKSKVNYKNKNELIDIITKDFYENKNSLTSGWDCLVYSSFDEQENKNIPDEFMNIIENNFLKFLKNCPKDLRIKGQYSISNVWYNVYEKNYFQEPHDHGESLFSGCYYLKFNKDIHHQTTFYNPNYNLDYKKIKDNSHFCNQINCEEDDIIIFPSNLKHGTSGMIEKKSDELRITISFNIENSDLCLNDQSKKISYE